MSIVDSITDVTPASDLHQWRGRPVPWVTMWTQESAQHTAWGIRASNGTIRATYNDDREIRDDFGVLWQREGVNRGGEPEWRRVSTYRQRSAMIHCRCQVCGKKIKDQPVHWLMPPEGIEVMPDTNDALTMQPPTCKACIPLALDVCPNLKKHGWMIAQVIDYEPWGVLGEIPALGPTGMAGSHLATVPYVNPGVPLTSVVARQLVVRLNKYRIAQRS